MSPLSWKRSRRHDPHLSPPMDSDTVTTRSGSTSAQIPTSIGSSNANFGPHQRRCMSLPSLPSLYQHKYPARPPVPQSFISPTIIHHPFSILTPSHSTFGEVSPRLLRFLPLAEHVTSTSTPLTYMSRPHSHPDPNLTLFSIIFVQGCH